MNDEELRAAVAAEEAYLTARDALTTAQDRLQSTEAMAMTGIGWAMVAVVDELRRIGDLLARTDEARPE